MLILICYERKTLLNGWLILTDKLKRTRPKSNVSLFVIVLFFFLSPCLCTACTVCSHYSEAEEQGTGRQAVVRKSWAWLQVDELARNTPKATDVCSDLQLFGSSPLQISFPPAESCPVLTTATELLPPALKSPALKKSPLDKFSQAVIAVLWCDSKTNKSCKSLLTLLVMFIRLIIRTF
jgi:hypothetical protein